jgi:hypothetical protein
MLKLKKDRFTYKKPTKSTINQNTDIAVTTKVKEG